MFVAYEMQLAVFGRHEICIASIPTLEHQKFVKTAFNYSKELRATVEPARAFPRHYSNFCLRTFPLAAGRFSISNKHNYFDGRLGKNIADNGHNRPPF